MVITPRHITANIFSFCQEISPTKVPFYITILPMVDCEPQQCHFNVEKVIKSHGGSIVHGWAVWIHQQGDWIEAEFHSVWKRPNGDLQDVTPDQDGENDRLFIVDPEHTFQGYALPKRYKVLSRRANIKQGIAKLAEADRLRCQFRANEPLPAADARQFTKLSLEGMFLLQGGTL